MPAQLAASAGIGASALPRSLFWWALAVVAAFRLVWLALYLYFGRDKQPLKLLTSELYSPTGGDDDQNRKLGIHQRVAAATDHLSETCLIVGTLALAAWTALFVVQGQTPGLRVSPTSRSLLLVGAAVFIAAPIFFRIPDYHTTYIGRRSAQFIGFTAVGLALTSLANDLLGGTLRLVITAGGVIALVLRDICDSIQEIRDEYRLLHARQPDAAEVLDRLRQYEPAFLERLVLKLLKIMGYDDAVGAAEHLGEVGDEGLDRMICQDPLGLVRIYVQANRYGASTTVGQPEIQKFVDALHKAATDGGIFVTTSRFTPEATADARKVARLVLIDGPALSELIILHKIDV